MLGVSCVRPLASRRVTALLVVGALVSACDGEALPDEESAVRSELTAAERAEVQAAFDDAACVCEAVTLLAQSQLGGELLFGTPTFTTTPVRQRLLPVSIADAPLRTYAEQHVSSTRPFGRRFCRSESLSSFSARGALPPRTLGDNATSACVARFDCAFTINVDSIGPASTTFRLSSITRNGSSSDECVNLSGLVA